MSNDSDVTLALQTSKILKLTIFRKNNFIRFNLKIARKFNFLFCKVKETNEVSEEVKPSEIASELKHIRQSIDKFLVKFEKSLKLDEKIQNSEGLTSAHFLKKINLKIDYIFIIKKI